MARVLSISKEGADVRFLSGSEHYASLGLFARMGLEQLLLASIFLLVLLRYRALIPLMYLLIVAHFVGGKIVAQFKPLALAGTSGVSTPFLVVAILSVGGLMLSLIGRGYADQSPRP